MNKKIVILNGSPRLSGNTAMLIKSFTDGATAAGHTVNCFHIQKMNIKPCLGCFQGGKNPEDPCVQKDDMSKIYPLYNEADIVCFASPLYYWNISGQLKCAIDRLFATVEGGDGISVAPKDCLLLMAAGGNDFDETLYWYQHLMVHMGWTDKGTILCGGVNYIGDITGNPKLEEAYQLGLSLS